MIRTNFAAIIGIFVLLGGCQEELDLKVNQATSPQYNFRASVLLQASHTDTILTEIYLRQLDFENLNETYKLILNFPAGFDGSIYYGDKAFRSGDWIIISYQQLQNYTTIVKVLPMQSAPGNYTFTYHCSDRINQTKSASVSIKLP